MSVQAMAYALRQRSAADPTARHVLLCMANYANADGRAAFASVATLAEDTGLSQRAVQYKIRELERLGLIWPGNQLVAAAHIRRGDKRPCVYDLAITDDQLRPQQAVHNPVDKPPNGVHHVHPVNGHGVQMTTERGAPRAPDPSLTVIPKTPLPPEGGAGVADANPETPNTEAGAGFTDFWQAYPRKVDQEKARRAWRTLHPDATLQATILAALQVWTRHAAWQRNGGQFIPKASNWLRGRRWQDMPDAAPVPPAAPTWQPPTHQAAPVPQAARDLLARLKVGKGRAPTPEAVPCS
jgi:hypothetical protein